MHGITFAFSFTHDLGLTLLAALFAGAP